MKDVIGRKRWRWVFLALSSLALAWTIGLLWQGWPELRQHLPQLHKGWLLLALACMLASNYLSFEAFRLILTKLKPGLYGRMYLAHLYFTSQLMKHLPGRIWGVAYQSNMGSNASLADWVAANVLNMMFHTWFAIWLAVSVLGFMRDPLWGVCITVTGLAIYFFAWKPAMLTGLMNLLRKVPARAINRIAIAVVPIIGVDLVFKACLLLIFGTSWALYLIAWAGFGLAWPGLNANDGVLLCAYYTVAWLVGYLSVITPSGLGVRELAFALLANRYPPDAITAVAIFGRAGLLVVDAIFGLFYAPFRGEKT